MTSSARDEDRRRDGQAERRRSSNRVGSVWHQCPMVGAVAGTKDPLTSADGPEDRVRGRESLGCGGAFDYPSQTGEPGREG